MLFQGNKRRVSSMLLSGGLLAIQWTSPGAVAVGSPNVAPAVAPAAFAQSAFEITWRRTDAPVASGVARRTWLWGPGPNTGGISEEYKQGAGGKRLVQYFDKSRMEVNNPAADPNSLWYVTNGLLTVELISGKVQTGDNSYEQRSPASVAVTGDAGDSTAPTYASFAGVSNASGDHRDTDRTGQSVVATLDRAGKTGRDATKDGIPGARIAYYEKLAGHNVPEAMWTFLNMTGAVEVYGQVQQQRLIEPWFYAAGLPISDAYWARASIGGKPTDVLVQAYERRVLTYVPTNPDGFKVEMGNVGQHYYSWRYSPAGPGPAPTVVAAPTAAPAPASLSRFSVDLNGDVSPGTLDGAVAAGAGAARVEMRWSEIERDNVSPAQYNWASTDNRLKRLSDKGLAPIVLVGDCPIWACSYAGGPIRIEHVSDFVEFMSAVAARYGKAPYNTHNWEFWNEPDSFSGEQNRYLWGTHPDRYAAMLAVVSPAMKAADPYAKTIMGGIAYDNFSDNSGPFNKGFVDGFLDAGGGGYIDYFNFHYYVQNVNWCSFTGKLQELRAKLAAHKVSVPIISTETGFTSSTQQNSSPEVQSMYAAQVYAQALGERMASVSWFTAKDFVTSNPGWQIFKDSGLMDVSLKPKPAFQAYKNAAGELNARNAVRALSGADGVAAPMRGYEFGADSAHPGSLWVVWAWDLSVYGPCGTAPAARDFVIPAGKAARVAKVADMYGQPLTMRTGADGSMAFLLDARPVYVEWR